MQRYLQGADLRLGLRCGKGWSAVLGHKIHEKLTFEVRQSCGIRRPPNLHACLRRTMDRWLSHVTLAVSIPARTNGTPPLRVVL